MATLLANKAQPIVATQWLRRKWRRQHAREPLSVAWRRLRGTKGGSFHLQQLVRVNRNDWAISRCKRGLGNDAWPSLHNATPLAERTAKEIWIAKNGASWKRYASSWQRVKQTEQRVGLFVQQTLRLTFEHWRSLLLKQPTLGVKRNFWPIIVCQLFCFTEQRNTFGDYFFDVCCVN